MKRKAEQVLDRDNLSDDDNQPSRPPANSGNIATPEEIAQRKIVKLKMPSQLQGNQGENGNKPAAKFELAGNLGGQNQSAEPTQPNTATQTPSFLSNIVTPTSSTNNAQPTQPSLGLFSNLLNKSAQEEGILPKEEKKSDLFANLFPKKPEGTAPAPLFGGTGTGLFSQNTTSGLFNQTTNAAAPKPAGGLFGSIFPGSGGGLSNLANKDYSYVHKESGEKKDTEDKKEAAKPQDKPVSSLFANLANYKPTTGLLSSSGENKPSLFANLTAGTTGLSSSLFGPNSLIGKKDEGSDGEEEGGEDPHEPSPEADVTKSKGNYQYQVDYDKLASKKVAKFKPGARNMLLDGEVSLNKNKEGTVYFLIYRNKAKLVQFQGQVIPKASTIEYLNPRQDAISVKTYNMEKADKSAPTEPAKEGETPAAANQPKLVKEIVKIMFASPDDCNAFKQELEKVIS